MAKQRNYNPEGKLLMVSLRIRDFVLDTIARIADETGKKRIEVHVQAICDGIFYENDLASKIEKFFDETPEIAEGFYPDGYQHDPVSQEVIPARSAAIRALAEQAIANEIARLS